MFSLSQYLNYSNSLVNLIGTPLKNIQKNVPSDIVISQEAEKDLMKITDLCSELGITEDETILYGDDKAKISLKKVMSRLKNQKNGKYVLITGMTPTKLGEGKSTTALGISQAIGAHLGKNVFTCLRQPSQGPTFGIKGGAAGGGYSQAVPMTDFNLHLTGDIHAISAANNLMAAAIDTRVFHEKQQGDKGLYRRLTSDAKGKRYFTPIMKNRLKKLGINKDDPLSLTKEERKKFARLDIDEEKIMWKRVVDCNDRFLRGIDVGVAPTEKGQVRRTGFDISVASEVMAILALSNDMKDMRRRLGNIVFAENKKGEAITAEDLGVSGAMAVLLKDTINPTLMQTIEKTPVFIHAGPFANIAHGNSSIIADHMALKIVGEDGYVLTEAGFGADIGMEKFFDIKCRYSGLQPDCAVIVASIRAIKHHGGMKLEDTTNESIEYLKKGICNLISHIENVKKYGIPAIVCINQFSSDTQKEIDFVQKTCEEGGAFACCPSEHWAKGGAGSIEISKKIIEACEQEKKFEMLYSTDEKCKGIKHNIEAIAKNIYGAKDVSYTKEVEEKIESMTRLGFSNLPICIAKTQYSLSHDPKLLGAPKGFTLPIKDIRCYGGAGLIVPLIGQIQTIPGLPTRPAYYSIDIDLETEKVIGLF